jgi:hypothetical protein
VPLPLPRPLLKLLLLLRLLLLRLPLFVLLRLLLLPPLLLWALLKTRHFSQTQPQSTPLRLLSLARFPLPSLLRPLSAVPSGQQKLKWLRKHQLLQRQQKWQQQLQ